VLRSRASASLRKHTATLLLGALAVGCGAIARGVDESSDGSRVQPALGDHSTIAPVNGLAMAENAASTTAVSPIQELSYKLNNPS
jgi:hypothetical protein